MSGRDYSITRPCESKLSCPGFMSPEKSALLGIILFSTFLSYSFYQPETVHSFSAKASKAVSNVTPILSY